MKVALVHDWLTGMRGGEKVLEVFCELFPDAKLFTLLREPDTLSEQIESMDIRTSFIQKLPGKRDYYRHYLPLFPLAIEQFCLNEFDLVISSSHCVAKGVLVAPEACHICYCHTPMRYIWDQYFVYCSPDKLKGIKKFIAPYTAHKLRVWDAVSSSRVDHFLAGSEHVARRIEHNYGRISQIIPPPVDIKRFKLGKENGNDGYFLVVSALVPYKRIDLAISAFNTLGYPLVIVGKGPEETKLKKIAKANIKFMGHSSDEEIATLYSGCRAFIFPGEEDFGITALEAQASGRPVIAFGRGGVLETVEEGVSGVFFHNSSVDSLVEAINRFEKMVFDPVLIRESVISYDRAMFKERVKKFISEKYKNFTQKGYKVC